MCVVFLLELTDFLCSSSQFLHMFINSTLPLQLPQSYTRAETPLPCPQSFEQHLVCSQCPVWICQITEWMRGPWKSVFIAVTYNFWETWLFSLFFKYSVQLLSGVWLFVTPWTAARQTSLSITNPRSLLKLMSVESVMPSNHLILCHPLLLSPSIFSSIRVFSNESVLPMKWPKHWSFSFSISPSNEYSGLISFKIDWLDILAVQETLKSLLQHHSSKALILWCSAF